MDGRDDEGLVGEGEIGDVGGEGRCVVSDSLAGDMLCRL